MHRRKFIGLAALSAPAALAAEGEDKPDYEKWWAAVETPDEYTAQSGEGNLKLKVELFTPPEDAVEEILDKDGTLLGYRYEGKMLPERYSRGGTLLVKFEFSWDGKPIPVDKRFWSDLAGLSINICTIDLPEAQRKHYKEFLDFLAALQQPRISLSADKGTALIEWERNEECDSRSIISWMISKSGTVLRHRSASDSC